MSKQNKIIKQLEKETQTFIKVRQIDEEMVIGNFENIEFFLDNSKDQVLDYVLEWASFHGNLQLVKNIISKGANINCSKGVALQMASRNGHFDIVQYLVEIGKIKNIDSTNILLEAVENKHLNIVQYLLEKNICDVHSEYDIALRTAIQLNDLEIVKCLIRHGADVNIFEGYPLIIASRIGCFDIINMLLDSGANKNFILQAIEIAKTVGLQNIVELLEKYQ